MNCVFCLDSDELREEQILVQSANFYICTPRGQIVEGYLTIAPYRCIGCMAHMPLDWFDELEHLKYIVSKFYLKAYESHHPIFYEQGRGGGGASAGNTAGFPFHAHLCCLPQSIDLHTDLARDYKQVPIVEHRALAETIGKQAYLYIEGNGVRFAYVGRTLKGCRDLEVNRLKLVIATLIGFPERGNWRTYPGDEELENLIAKWNCTFPQLQRKSLIPPGD